MVTDGRLRVKLLTALAGSISLTTTTAKESVELLLAFYASYIEMRDKFFEQTHNAQSCILQ